jgi:hypothetical protein
MTYVVTILFRAQGYQPTIHRCAPARPAATHVAQPRSALPLRARGRCAWCTRTRTRPCARVRYLHPHLPDSAPAEARLPQRDATCAGHRHVRERRLACFADGLHVAPPVQAAAGASGRARRPPRPRHLRHDRQARRRHNGHDDPAVITPAGSAAWPGGAKPVPTKPVCWAWSSSRLRPVGALVYPLTIKSGPVDSSLVIGATRMKALPRRLSPRVHHITASRSAHSPV